MTVEHLFKELEETTFSLDEQPYGSLFQLFKSDFLDVSVHIKLIDPHKLTLAGDGTPVVTSASERKHRVCHFASKRINNCNCDRYFLSLIVTWVGIHQGITFIMVTIFTCWWLLILTVTFPYSHYSTRLHA